MGFIDFMKDAGEKIFKPGEVRREDAIEKHLASYGIAGVSVEVEGDVATLTGSVKDQETREKAVLIAGNISGISRVNDKITAPASVKPVVMDGAGNVLATTTSTVQPAGARTLSMTLAAGNYRFQVTAINAAGQSARSARSNLVVAR